MASEDSGCLVKQLPVGCFGGFIVFVGGRDLGGQQQIVRLLGTEVKGVEQMLFGCRRVGGALQPGEGAIGLGLRCRVGRVGLERDRSRQLLQRLLRMTLPGEQQAKRKARFEPLGIGLDRLFVVGDRGVGMVLGVLKVTEIEERPGIIRVGGEPGKQQAPRLGVVLQRNIALGVSEGRCCRGLRGLRRRVGR